jgi:hypothetical protein
MNMHTCTQSQKKHLSLVHGGSKDSIKEKEDNRDLSSSDKEDLVSERFLAQILNVILIQLIGRGQPSVILVKLIIAEGL